jgi:predicted PurR-regulated permease PerM
MEKKTYWNIDRIMNLVFVLAGCVLLFFLFSYLSDVLFPFVVAFLVAYLLNPFVDMLQKKVRIRALAAVIVLLVAGGLLTLVLSFLIPAIVSEGSHLGQLLMKLLQDTSWRSRVTEYIPHDLWNRIWAQVTQANVIAALQNFDLWKTAQSLVAKLLPGAWGVLSGTGKAISWVLGVAMILLYLLFMLIDFERIVHRVSSEVPEKYRPQVYGFFRTFDHTMSRYFRAQTLVASIVGVLFATAFSIMGLPMGLPFGLLIGAMNMVPYLQLTSIPLAVFLGLIYSLETGMAFWQVALIVTAIYLGVQALQDMVIVPKVMGSALGLSPILILLSLSVWGALLGFLGMVVAIPFTCIAIATYEAIRRKDWKE